MLTAFGRHWINHASIDCSRQGLIVSTTSNSNQNGCRLCPQIVRWTHASAFRLSFMQHRGLSNQPSTNKPPFDRWFFCACILRCDMSHLHFERSDAGSLGKAAYGRQARPVAHRLASSGSAARTAGHPGVPTATADYRAGSRAPRAQPHPEPSIAARLTGYPRASLIVRLVLSLQ